MADTCSCGSGKKAAWVLDARAIPVAKCCDDCRADKLRGYRADIFTDSHYPADEPIEAQ
jgi:hypothetical protein